METIFQIALFAVFAWACYKSGKHLGSRKGYQVGRRHRRSYRR